MGTAYRREVALEEALVVGRGPLFAREWHKQSVSDLFSASVPAFDLAALGMLPRCIDTSFRHGHASGERRRAALITCVHSSFDIDVYNLVLDSAVARYFLRSE